MQASERAGALSDSFRPIEAVVVVVVVDVHLLADWSRRRHRHRHWCTQLASYADFFSFFCKNQARRRSLFLSKKRLPEDWDAFLLLLLPLLLLLGRSARRHRLAPLCNCDCPPALVFFCACMRRFVHMSVRMCVKMSVHWCSSSQSTCLPSCFLHTRSHLFQFSVKKIIWIWKPQKQ